MQNHMQNYVIGDNLVVQNEKSHKLFLLNPSARFIFEKLADINPMDKLTAAYSRKFGVGQDIAGRDIKTTLSEWEKTGLLNNSSVHAYPPTASCRESKPILIPDKMHWKVRKKHQIFHNVFELKVSDSALIAEIHPLIAQWETSASADEIITFSCLNGKYTVGRNGKQIGNAPSKHEAVGMVLQEIVNIIHAPCEWMAVLHGAAVARNEKAIILSAAGGSGKSTLAAALSAKGFNFFSDDTVPLERHEQRVMPVPFNMCIKRGSWKILSRDFPDMIKTPIRRRYGQTVRYLTPSRSWKNPFGAPAACIVFPQFNPEKTTRVRPLSPVDAFRKIIESGAWISHDPEVLQVFIRWVESIPGYRLHYKSLEEAVRIVDELTAS